MSNAPEQTTVTVTPAQPTPATAQNIDTTGQPQEQTIPYSRFKEVNDALAELKRKDAEREAKERAEVEKRAKQNGEYEQLLQTREKELEDIKPQVTTLQERVKAFEDLIAKEVTDGIKELPEELRAMRPDGDVLTQREWLSKARIAAAKLQIQRSPGTPPGPRGTGAQTVTVAAPALKPVGDGF